MALKLDRFLSLVYIQHSKLNLEEMETWMECVKGHGAIEDPRDQYVGTHYKTSNRTAF